MENNSIGNNQGELLETDAGADPPSSRQSATNSLLSFPIPPSTSSSVLDAKSSNFVLKAPVLRILPNPAPALLNVTNVDTLVRATKIDGQQIEAPPQVVFEKISLMFNNLSESNIPSKAKEVKEVIVQNGQSFLRWLAQYLVMKRVTVEQDYQPLYNSLLVAVKEECLDSYVMRETLRNVCIILRSNKGGPNSFGDRQILKNLGFWLGAITIARDIPILSKDMDLKLLLLDAFYKGQQELLYVVPFVVKTILASGKSTVFKPKSSWIFGIIKVLVELHNEPDLKLNLKFEIEVLCNSLDIELRSVEVGSFLKDTHNFPNLILADQAGSLVDLQEPSLIPAKVDHLPTFNGLSLEPSLRSDHDLSNTLKKMSMLVEIQKKNLVAQNWIDAGFCCTTCYSTQHIAKECSVISEITGVIYGEKAENRKKCEVCKTGRHDDQVCILKSIKNLKCVNLSLAFLNTNILCKEGFVSGHFNISEIQKIFNDRQKAQQARSES